MSATEIIKQIKLLPRDEKWTILRVLREEMAQTDAAALAADFTMIGSDKELSDVEFAVAAQAEVLKHG